MAIQITILAADNTEYEYNLYDKQGMDAQEENITNHLNKVSCVTKTKEIKGLCSIRDCKARLTDPRNKYY